MACVLAVLVACAAPALATGMLTTGTIVRIQATSGAGVGELAYFIPAATPISGEYQWSLQSLPATIRSSTGVALGTVNSLGLKFDADPYITLNFDVTSPGVTTTFDILSDTLSFDPIANPEAFANAGATLVDADNSGYAKLTGQFPTPWGINSAFDARYNGTTAWADLIAPMTLFNAGASMLAEEGRPEPPPSTNREAIAATVSSIRCEWKFSLTANDRAYGTGTFNLLPEPATAMLLLLGLSIFKRRS
jgi:hypothetical protein